MRGGERRPTGDALDAGADSFLAEVAKLFRKGGPVSTRNALPGEIRRFLSGRTTHQFPATLGDGFEAVDRFHVDGVDDAGFGDPDRAEEVRPLARRRLLEGSVRVGAQDAGLVGRSGGRSERGGEGFEAGERKKRTTGLSGETVHLRQSHCPSGI